MKNVYVSEEKNWMSNIELVQEHVETLSVRECGMMVSPDQPASFHGKNRKIPYSVPPIVAW